MKLTGQASQYWTNLVNMRAARDQEPIDSWRRMKDEFKGKYVPPWTNGTDTLKATNRRRSAWKSLMSSSSDATPLTLKGKLKKV